MSIPYIPLYVADYEGDTAHLTMEEDGAYLRLLRLCWRTPGCSVPDDPKWIMRKMRISADDYYRVVEPLIDEFFTRGLGRVFSPRLQAESQRISATSKKRSDAGRKGGRPNKSLKDKEKSKSPAKAKQKQPEPEPEPYNSVPNGTDASVGFSGDFTKEIFDRGVAFLGKYGTPDRSARRIIGKWRRDAGDGPTYEALASAHRAGVTDPVSYITAILKPKDQKPNITEMLASAAKGMK